MPEAPIDIATRAEQAHSSEDIQFCVDQLVEIILNTSETAEYNQAQLERINVFWRDEPGLVIAVAAELAKHRRADVRLHALGMLEPYSGFDADADAVLWTKLLDDKTQGVLVATYEMLVSHSQNATFEDLHGDQIGEHTRRTFPGLLANDRTVLLSGAIPRYERATKNRK